MKWLIGLGAAIGVWLLINKQKANASPTQSTQLQPVAGTSVPSPTLCQAAVTLGGAATGVYYGVPPSVTLPVGAGVSKPICEMGGKVANAVKPYAVGYLKAATAPASVTFDGIKTGAKAYADIVKAQLTVAKSVTSPSKFANATVDLAQKTVTAPVKTVTAVGKSAVKNAKKLNPFSW